MRFVISVGYCVHSLRGVEFRRWATSVLKEYVLHGYAVKRKRLVQLGQTVELTYDECRAFINDMKVAGSSALFGNEKDFRPLALIGRGGMGEVYVARQLSLDREVAVKIIASTRTRDAEFRARFLAEARTVARLHHPNIVQTIAAGEANGRLYFAMEHIDGKAAAEHRFGRPEELVSCGIRVAEALAYAHACGVVHRDVKPSNIFIGSDGAVKLGDFGLAGLVGEESCDRSGTKKYMAPEQRASGQTDAKSDQYSFGVTMLELAASFPELLGIRRQTTD